MELLYHEISSDCKCCYLKAKVCPSQRVTSNPHNTWILILELLKVHTAVVLLGMYHVLWDIFCKGTCPVING